MASTYQRKREDLGARLRALRDQTGLAAKELAHRLGWTRSKLSKLEHGKQTATREDLSAWLAALNVTGSEAEHLHDALTELLQEYVAWKEAVRSGHKARQDEAGAIESRARIIRAVDIGVVPGLLQTADYARHVLMASANLHGGGHDLIEAVRSRMQRQHVLYEPGRTIELLMTEAALLHPVAPPDVMAGQVHRLVAAVGTPNVRIGVLPARTRLPYPLIHSYWILDRLVLVETLAGELRVEDPDAVATYSELTDLLWRSAVEGDELRGLLARHAEFYATA